MSGRSIAWSLAPLGLAVLVMLPRLASPQFGFLDDGLTLQTGREMSGRWFSVLHLIPETGRFFPVYWLAYSLVVSVVGVRPLAFFVVNVLLLAGLLAILARLVRLTGGTRSQAAVAAVMVALSGPAIETFYTLSKAESLQLTWIGLSLLAAAASATAARWTTRVALGILAAAASFLAHATKETSVVLIPIFLGWVVIECWLVEMSPQWARFARTCVVSSLIGAAAFFALRSHYAALTIAEGAYTRAYGLYAVGPALFRIVAWLARDFAFLLPLAVAALWRLGVAPAGRRPLLYASVWMAGWLAVYLPWPVTFGYHLLPFAFGAAVLAGTVVGDLWRWCGAETPAARRRLARSALVAAGLLWCVALVNAVTDARVQLALDRANTALVDFLGGLPKQSRVVLNMSPVNEYHFSLPRHIAEIKRRGDIVVARVGSPALDLPSGADVFVATAEMAHEPWPTTVRIAPHEPGVRRDNATLLVILLRDRADLVYRSVEHTPLLELGIQRLLCPLAVNPVVDATFCPPDRALIDRRTFSYGWQVHRLVQGAPATPQRALETSR